MKKILLSVLPLCLLVFTAVADAAYVHTTTQIEKVTFYEDARIVIVYPKTPITFADGDTKNSCAVVDYISFNIDRVMADTYVSGLMMAFAAKQPVEMTIANDCLDHSVSLTLVYFSVLEP